MNWSKLCFTISVISLIHAAYSAAQYRKYLRLTEQEYTALPSDILTQALISLAVSCYTISLIVGDFREVRLINDMENKNVESLMTRPSFYNFNHRGKYLHSLLQIDPHIDRSLKMDSIYQDRPASIFDDVAVSQGDIERDLLRADDTSSSSTNDGLNG